MNGSELINVEDIQNRIYTIRGVQVMFDEDLALLYGVETRVLNQAVKRNNERFPEEFMFQLSENELNILKSQIVIPSWGGRRTSPYAFQRLDTLETKQLATDKKIDHVLNAIESKEIQLKQGIFFDGQIFDAYKFVADLIRTAQKSIVLIDNYIDDSVLTVLAKRRKNVKVMLLTRSISNQMALDVKKFNEQYPRIEIKEFKNSHDRFIIIDNNTVYHFGASLKDLGKKWFAFSKMDIGAIEMLARLKGMK